MGVLVEEKTSQQFFNLAVVTILFVWKGRLLILQEIQEVNKKNKRTTSWNDVDNQLLPKIKYI